MTAPHIATAKSLHMRADCHGPDLAASNPATWERRLVPVIRRTLESGLLRGYSHCGKRGIWARFATIEWNPEPATVLKKNYVYFRLLIFFLQEHTLVKLTFESQHEAATKNSARTGLPHFFLPGGRYLRYPIYTLLYTLLKWTYGCQRDQNVKIQENKKKKT
jgi:hypothetical protein